MYTGKADRMNELPGIELEGKLAIVGDCQINKIAEIIFEALSLPQEKDGYNGHPYTIAPNASQIRPSQTRAHYYGYKDKTGATQKAFTVMERLRDGHLQIKRKATECTIYRGNIFDRAEEMVPIDWPIWNEEVAQAIAIQESAVTGYLFDPTHVFLIVDVTERKKLKVRVQNHLNARTYTIGIDETIIQEDKRMQQVEIEYIGTENIEAEYIEAEYNQNKQATSHSIPDIETTLLEIVDEIKAIEQIVIENCMKAGILLQPTQMTKFDWLLSLG